jgi:hypothetical protein
MVVHKIDKKYVGETEMKMEANGEVVTKGEGI